MSEPNHWRESEKHFREGALMALTNARIARIFGDEKAAQEAERRSQQYLKWADQDRIWGDAYEQGTSYELAN